MKRLLMSIVACVAVCAASMAQSIYEKAEAAFENKQYEEAIALYRLCAEEGDSEALNKMGGMYVMGLGVEANPQKAFELFTEAAEKGNLKALCNLGLLYEDGNGVQKDILKAIECYTEAAKLGETEAMKRLGVIYLFGTDGIAQDTDKAIEWFVKATEQGDYESYYALGLIYENRIYHRNDLLGKRCDCLRPTHKCYL